MRPSPIAGQWYPDNATTLVKNLERYLEAAPPVQAEGCCLGVIVPHAGLRYSGPVAAYAFRGLRDLRPDLIVVIGPMHYSHPGALLTTAHDAYETPLGATQVDHQIAGDLDRLLMESSGRGLTKVRRDPEHSVEIELPFLQHLFGEFRLLPIMIGDQRRTVVEALGHALGAVLRDQNALLVASSDLSHFYPESMAQQLDGELLRRVAAFDPSGVLEADEAGVGFACGRGAMAAVLWAAADLGANRVTVLHRATSGDVTGDFSSVVGYAAAAIWRTCHPAGGEEPKEVATASGMGRVVGSSEK